MKRLLCWILSLCLLLCLVPGAAAAERVTGTLERRAGYDLAVDGIFGTMTRCSVKGFQSERGLQVDGIVGKQTWAALEGGGA